jgi:hypothetical protein
MLLEEFVYCHIPKTAGNTICSLINKVPWHTICKKDNRFLFTFVRNPYSRCLSAFNYLKNGGDRKEDQRDSDIYIGNLSFDDFVTNKLHLALVKQTHFKPQTYWLPDGADFIGRYENLLNDINHLKTLIKMNDFVSLPHINKTKHYFYTELNNDTKEIIFSLYKHDFETFGYQK